jgi:hypothetical protein
VAYLGATRPGQSHAQRSLIQFASAYTMFSMVPDFDDLPAVEGMPQGCAWGVFDRNGQKDLRGTLNLLTPEVVAAACKEARDGVSISLK